ncbi:MAG TPA: cation diffusion facilitator family transporter [Limnochordia bacterium]
MGDAVRVGLRVTLIGAGANLFLALTKLAFGLAGHSTALIADAVNSAADIVGGSAALFGLWVGRRPADPRHPYGHRRFETEVTRLIGLLFVVTGLWLSWTAAHALWRGTPARPEWIALWAACATLLLKEWLFHYTLRAARTIKSPALAASAWDHRWDGWISLAAILGIVGARIGWPGFDALAALVVSLFVIWVGARFYWEATSELVDTGPSPELTRAVRRVASAIPGIVEVQEVKGRRHGPEIYFDVKVSVAGSLTVEAGHSIAKAVKEAVIEEIDGVKDVLVHVNPAR